MLKLSAEIEGRTLSDIESGLREVLRLVTETYTSGNNSNDDGKFNFTMDGNDEDETAG